MSFRRVNPLEIPEIIHLVGQFLPPWSYNGDLYTQQSHHTRHHHRSFQTSTSSTHFPSFSSSSSTTRTFQPQPHLLPLPPPSITNTFSHHITGYNPRDLLTCVGVNRMWRQILLPVLWQVYCGGWMLRVPNEIIVKYSGYFRVLVDCRHPGPFRCLDYRASEGGRPVVQLREVEIMNDDPFKGLSVIEFLVGGPWKDKMSCSSGKHRDTPQQVRPQRAGHRARLAELRILTLRISRDPGQVLERFQLEGRKHQEKQQSWQVRSLTMTRLMQMAPLMPHLQEFSLVNYRFRAADLVQDLGSLVPMLAMFPNLTRLRFRNVMGIARVVGSPAEVNAVAGARGADGVEQPRLAIRGLTLDFEHLDELQAFPPNYSLTPTFQQSTPAHHHHHHPHQPSSLLSFPPRSGLANIIQFCPQLEHLDLVSPYPDHLHYLSQSLPRFCPALHSFTIRHSTVPAVVAKVPFQASAETGREGVGSSTRLIPRLSRYRFGEDGRIEPRFCYPLTETQAVALLKPFQHQLRSVSLEVLTLGSELTEVMRMSRETLEDLELKVFSVGEVMKMVGLGVVGMDIEEENNKEEQVEGSKGGVEEGFGLEDEGYGDEESNQEQEIHDDDEDNLVQQQILQFGTVTSNASSNDNTATVLTPDSPNNRGSRASPLYHSLVSDFPGNRFNTNIGPFLQDLLQSCLNLKSFLVKFVNAKGQFGGGRYGTTRNDHGMGGGGEDGSLGWGCQGLESLNLGRVVFGSSGLRVDSDGLGQEKEKKKKKWRRMKSESTRKSSIETKKITTMTTQELILVASRHHWQCHPSLLSWAEQDATATLTVDRYFGRSQQDPAPGLCNGLESFYYDIGTGFEMLSLATGMSVDGQEEDGVEWSRMQDASDMFLQLNRLPSLRELWLNGNRYHKVVT